MTEREYFDEAKNLIDESGLDLSTVREFMDELRDRGNINMMGAGQYLQTEFGFTRHEVKPIVLDYLHHGLLDDVSDDQADPDVILITVDRVELAAILAGLRMLQRPGKVPQTIADIWTDCGSLKALQGKNIGDLCERINCGGSRD